MKKIYKLPINFLTSEKVSIKVEILVDISRNKVVFKLLEDLTIELSNGETCYIKGDYVTDFASIPRFLWSFLSPISRGSLAFIVHDFLYEFGYYVNQEALQVYVTKEFADKQMKHLQLAFGENNARVQIMYLAVKYFGYSKKFING